MICVKPIEQLNRAYKIPNKKHFSNYPACMQRNIEKIKRILKTDPTPQIYIGNNWIRINGQSFNGITREMFNEIIKEISCNIAINNV